MKASLLFFLPIVLLLSGCFNPNIIEDDCVCKLISNQSNPMKEKFAVIVVGTSSRIQDSNVVDNYIINSNWLLAARIYNSLLLMNYEAKNIFVLYKDGNPPVDNEYDKLGLTIEIKKEFNGEYSNVASIKNMRDILNCLERRIGTEDEFTLFLNFHGNRFGNLKFEEGNGIRSLSAQDLDDILLDNKAKSKYIIIDTCYANSFAQYIETKSKIVASSEWSQKSRMNRDGSYSSIFFNEWSSGLLFEQGFESSKISGKWLLDGNGYRFEMNPVYREQL